ncbi:MAG: hypothetical protein H0X50_07950 [Nitrosopumilus sp.]|nr:hypothetical protein [Nitrosopumilus sp.]
MPTTSFGLTSGFAGLGALLILVRSFSLNSSNILPNSVRSGLGNKDDNKGISLSIRLDTFFLIMDFNLYSYDLETFF